MFRLFKYTLVREEIRSLKLAEKALNFLGFFLINTVFRLLNG